MSELFILFAAVVALVAVAVVWAAYGCQEDE